MKRGSLRRGSAAALLFGVAALAAADAPAPGVDPPAVTVFPDHDRIGSASYPLERAVADGRALFKAKFNRVDGAGRPRATGDSKPTPRSSAGPAFLRIPGPDANSCAGCHNEPMTGGSGEFVTNVFVGAHLSDPPTASAAASGTNERNTVTLFGSGAVELVAREMTEELHAQRQAALAQAGATGQPAVARLRGKTTDFGAITAFPDGTVNYDRLEGVDFDLIVRPFGIKGVATSLREFTTFALNQHHGIQPVERFGWERTGVADFDGDGHETEMTIGQVTALVLFQATLPPPNRQAGSRATPPGARLFQSIGCAGCHTPRTALRSNVFTEPGEFNRPGAMSARDAGNVVRAALDLAPAEDGGYLVEMYSDLKRHRMCDDEVRDLCNEQRRQDNVPVEWFMTQKLWDLATSAPYGHRGDCGTLSEIVVAHGGEARPAREAFLALPDGEKRSLIEFLLSLGSEQVVE